MKYQVGQYVHWKHPEGSGGGIIRAVSSVRPDGSIWYEVGKHCWVEEPFIDAARDENQPQMANNPETVESYLKRAHEALAEESVYCPYGCSGRVDVSDEWHEHYCPWPGFVAAHPEIAPDHKIRLIPPAENVV